MPLLPTPPSREVPCSKAAVGVVHSSHTREVFDPWEILTCPGWNRDIKEESLFSPTSVSHPQVQALLAAVLRQQPEGEITLPEADFSIANITFYEYRNPDTREITLRMHIGSAPSVPNV